MDNNIPQVYVGIDVSKNFLDIHIYPLEKSFNVANSKQGIESVIRKLANCEVAKIAFESTGGYEYLLFKMMNKSFSTWRIEPKRVKAFIVSEGIKAKTDKIDARMLALFAASRTQKYQALQISVTEERLRALSMRRTDLIEIINKENNRLKHPQQLYCKKSLGKHIAFMEKQIKQIEVEINDLVIKDLSLKKKAEVIESMPGVGRITAFSLIAHMPELGIIGSKQITALLGVAPFDRQSGNYKGTATIKGGRWHLRKILYMAAIAAARFNPNLKVFYDRLRSNGKKPKLALVAVMRKMIVTLNAMLHAGKIWQVA